MQISIVIVNYNVRYFLEQCLYSLEQARAGLAVEVIVVDNQSTDGSIPYLQPRFPWVHFIANTSNPGFARACNQGGQFARGQYVLFLNPDTILPEDCLHRCLQFFEGHPDAGALGVKMVDGSGRFLKESKRAFPSPMTSLYKLSGLIRLAPRSKVFARYYLGHLADNQNHQVDVLAGAFMMIRKDVLDKVGGFDEAFFMYGEDIDLSYRIQKSGYHNYYLADTCIIHFKGESTKRSSLNYVRVFYQAMSIFVRKHYGKTRAGIFTISVQLAIRIRALLAALGKVIHWAVLPLRTMIGKRPANRRPYLLVACAPMEFAGVKRFLEKKGLAQKIIGRVAVDSETAVAVARLEEVGQTASALNARELILCAGSLSYSRIIASITAQKTSLRYRFHKVGSGSMVASDSAGSAGEALSEE